MSTLNVENTSLLGFDVYEELVAATRRPDPITHMGPLLSSEFWELLVQHKDTYPLLLAIQAGKYRVESKHPLAEIAIDGLIEEMGDLWWFGVTEAYEQGSSIQELCNNTISRWAGSTATQSLLTMQDFESAVITHADKMRVPRKRGLLRLEGPKPTDYTSLKDSPGYLLMRTGMRLMRAYGQSEPLPPFTASDLETPPEKLTALGDHLGAITYIGSRCLKRSLEQLVLSNIIKLSEREPWGKPPEMLDETL